MPIFSQGQTLTETYQVERLLGEGAFAEVYRVRHRFLGRQAMKVFKSASVQPPDVESEIREALLLSELRHPNVVEVYDANILKLRGLCYGYFTMNYMPGGTLDRYWRSFGSSFMPVEQAVDIIKQACRGLAIAHSATPPIIHRDIKPQNILIGFDSVGLHVRVGDFGLAKSVNPLTLLASARGTLDFKPPEALTNLDSCASDIWSLGATLYLLLTDTLPAPSLSENDARDPGRFLRSIRPPSVYNISVDPGLEAVVFRCLAHSPSDRYAHAGELLADLERWTPGRGVSSASVSELGASAKAVDDSGQRRDLGGEATEALDEAMHLARDPARLMSAADLLEEAMSKDPSLRERYQSQLTLWRRGIMSGFTAEIPARARRKQ